ncbi:MAG: T9SS type A sorting domain-containing protein, partial [candidate division WOR-3 bacterium]
GIGEIKSQKLEFKQIITVIRGMLYLPEGTKGNPVFGVLFDALGQKVARLGPGPNDVSPLPSGVYFLRIFSEGKVTDSRKVIIAE